MESPLVVEVRIPHVGRSTVPGSMSTRRRDRWWEGIAGGEPPSQLVAMGGAKMVDTDNPKTEPDSSRPPTQETYHLLTVCRVEPLMNCPQCLRGQHLSTAAVVGLDLGWVQKRSAARRGRLPGRAN